MPGRRFQRFKAGRADDPDAGTEGPLGLKLRAADLMVDSPGLPNGDSMDQAALQAEQRLTYGPIGESARINAARRRDTRYRRALALADLVAATVALALGVIVLGGDRVRPALIAAIPLVVLVSKVVGLYDRDERLLRKTTLEEAPALFQVTTLYTLILWLGEGAFVQESVLLARGDDLGREQVVGIWGLLFVCMLASRAIAREIVRRTTPSERCVVLGTAAAADRVQRKVESARALNAEVLGRVPLELDDVGTNGPALLGDIASLERILSERNVERVIIAPTSADTEQLLGAIRLAKSLGVKVSVLPRLFEVVGSAVVFDDVEGLLLLGVPPYGLSKSSRVLKRAIDLCGAFFGLLLMSPLIAGISAVIKLSSRGPVLFRQRRIGREGREFTMLKFRTMYDGADEDKDDLLGLNEADGLFKIADDPRLTGIGQILRRFSLDELPQLVNVLRGEMSLVGPRPLVVDDDARVEGWERRRLDLPPGMTGIWQVLGSSARIPLSEMVKIDYLYGASWSLWLDLKILLRTVPHVLGRRGI